MLSSLPFETVEQILSELDWFAIRAVRKTCTFLRDVSRSHAVWSTQVLQYHSQCKTAPPLEMPVGSYSTAELERLVGRRIQADAKWKSRRKLRIQTRLIKSYYATWSACLVPGGRWLLVSDGRGAVRYHDLDEPRKFDLTLIETEYRSDFMTCIEIDQTSPTLALRLLLMPGYIYSSTTLSVVVWAVKLVGHGKQARLEASQLQSVQIPSSDSASRNTTGLTLHGNLFGRITGYLAHQIEIYDWKSPSETCLKAVIVSRYPEPAFSVIRLLPFNRLLAVTDEYFTIYDILNIVNEEPPGPYSFGPRTVPQWKLSSPVQSLVLDGGISAPLHDARASYFTFVAATSVYGLIIPSDPDIRPQIVEVAHFPMTIPYTNVCLGFNKMFAQGKHGVLTRASFDWDRDRETPDMEESTHYPIFSDYPSDWPENLRRLPPVLDEHSGRVVRCWRGKGIYILDPTVK